MIRSKGAQGSAEIDALLKSVAGLTYFSPMNRAALHMRALHAILAPNGVLYVWYSYHPAADGDRVHCIAAFVPRSVGLASIVRLWSGGRRQAKDTLLRLARMGVTL